jgi:proteasome beta subunit
VTLVIALVCADGVIMASDSQATEGSGDVKFPTQKVFQLGPRALIGGSGAVQVITEIRSQLLDVADLLEGSPDRCQSLASNVQPVLQKHYSRYVQVPFTQPAPPAADTLVCGFDGQGKPWIIEVDPRCACTPYEERGFHAIGSGAGFAHIANLLMAHFQAKDRPLSQGKLIAYRAVRSVIEASASGVGGAVQMSTVDAGGVHQLTDEEVNEVRTGVGTWEQLEQETLEKVLGGAEEDVGPEMPPPMPPA